MRCIRGSHQRIVMFRWRAGLLRSAAGLAGRRRRMLVRILRVCKQLTQILLVRGAHLFNSDRQNGPILLPQFYGGPVEGIQRCLQLQSPAIGPGPGCSASATTAPSAPWARVCVPADENIQRITHASTGLGMAQSPRLTVDKSRYTALGLLEIAHRRSLPFHCPALAVPILKFVKSIIEFGPL